MGNLTVRMLAETIRYEVGSRPGTSVEFRELVNQAGEFFVGMYPWKWLEGRQLILRRRPAIELEGATWTQATLRLTKVGAFADYEFLSGDTAVVTEGTGATPGTYEVVARVDDDSITLRTSIGSAADGQTDIEAQLPNDQVSLEPDFSLQAITAYSMTDGLVGAFEFTSPQGLLDLRTWPGLTSTISIWAIVNWVRGTSGGQPVPRLDLWPERDSSDEELVIFYRGGWREPADDAEVIGIPGWTNLLFTEVVKAVVNGYEDPEGGTVDQRVTVLTKGSLFANAIERDALIQPDVGPMVNGWAEPSGSDDAQRFSLYRSGMIS